MLPQVIHSVGGGGGEAKVTPAHRHLWQQQHVGEMRAITVARGAKQELTVWLLELSALKRMTAKRSPVRGFFHTCRQCVSESSGAALLPLLLPIRRT